MRVLFLFGPSLGALGTREPERYGTQTLQEIMHEVTERADALGHETEWRQSDHEGELVGWLLGARGDGFDVLVVNPGALTHYSYAIRDAIEASGVPAIEVHMTNIYAREACRRESVISDLVVARGAGPGPEGDRQALELLAAHQNVGPPSAA